MISILIVGAGKSSSYLIKYALQKTELKQGTWHVVIADNNEQTLKEKVVDFPKAEIAVLDINNTAQRQKLVKQADLVLSLMPPQLHILLAKDCLQFKKNLITSSYVSPEMLAMHQDVKDAGLMFMCEMGLDPGIDHMSASKIFDGVGKVASDIQSFYSYCGGLIAPVSDDNPWHYKFSWNPLNVVNAGKDGAHYLRNNEKIFLPYESLFEQNKTINCAGVGELAFYPNRDSLSYIDLYNQQNAKDFMRATLRHPSFCKGWDALIKLGLTDTTSKVSFDGLTTWADLVAQLTGYNDSNKPLSQFAFEKINTKDEETRKMLEWLGIFENKQLPTDANTPGTALLANLVDKWKLAPEDKDMVVMQHEVTYKHRNFNNKLTSTMVVIGEDASYSAMAKTVGLPIALLADLVVSNKATYPKGVTIPTMADIYRPILTRLERYGINFTETIVTIEE